MTEIEVTQNEKVEFADSEVPGPPAMSVTSNDEMVGFRIPGAPGVGLDMDEVSRMIVFLTDWHARASARRCSIEMEGLRCSLKAHAVEVPHRFPHPSRELM